MATGVVVENGDQIILSVLAEPASTVVTVPIKFAIAGYDVSARRARFIDSETDAVSTAVVAFKMYVFELLAGTICAFEVPVEISSITVSVPTVEVELLNAIPSP